MAFNIEYEIGTPYSRGLREICAPPPPPPPLFSPRGALGEFCTVNPKECKTAITPVSNFNEAPPRFRQKLIKMNARGALPTHGSRARECNSKVYTLDLNCKYLRAVIYRIIIDARARTHGRLCAFSRKFRESNARYFHK